MMEEDECVCMRPEVQWIITVASNQYLDSCSLCYLGSVRFTPLELICFVMNTERIHCNRQGD